MVDVSIIACAHVFWGYGHCALDAGENGCSAGMERPVKVGCVLVVGWEIWDG